MSANPSAITHRVLIVEDDDTARISLLRILERAGYDVTAVPDGESACALLEGSPATRPSFDAVVSDLLLREIDGVGVLRAARSQPSPPEVILLTGYGTLHTALEALRGGAFDYLLKPCKPDQLLQCVAGAIGRREEHMRRMSAVSSIAHGLAQLHSSYAPGATLTAPAPAAPARQEPSSAHLLRVGALTINVLDYAVSFDGAALQLTPTEYALLLCLARAGGHILSYREIVQHTYNHDVVDSEAHQLLKTHIYNLRHKIDPDYIINVRGFGYRLIDPRAS
jgi:two-component system, OmpR family, response regulator